MAAIERNPSAPQADPDVIDALKGIGVALLSDQLRRNRGTKGLAPYHRPAAMAGTAVTVRTRGGDNLAILRAYDFCRPGDVMVVAADGDLDNALVGGIMTLGAAALGLAGMVLDGAIRDVAEIRERTFPSTPAGSRIADLTKTVLVRSTCSSRWAACRFNPGTLSSATKTALSRCHPKKLRQ